MYRQTFVVKLVQAPSKMFLIFNNCNLVHDSGGSTMPEGIALKLHYERYRDSIIFSINLMYAYIFRSRRHYTLTYI